MRITIGRGKRAQSIAFATGKGWTKDNTQQIVDVMNNVGFKFAPAGKRKRHA